VPAAASGIPLHDALPICRAAVGCARMSERRPHLAVALHYTGSGAPRVVAKGGGKVAERIIETARQHNVPLQEDAQLAAALSRLRSEEHTSELQSRENLVC